MLPITPIRTGVEQGQWTETETLGSSWVQEEEPLQREGPNRSEERQDVGVKSPPSSLLSSACQPCCSGGAGVLPARHLCQNHLRREGWEGWG